MRKLYFKGVNNVVSRETFFSIQSHYSVAVKKTVNRD